MAESKAVCTKCQSLREEVDLLREDIKRLHLLVSNDSLTGLFNYHYFTQALSKEIERSKRTGQPTVLIMVDADYFKKVNDQWGHEVGNQALKFIARSITAHIRQLDIACRYGGEEFAIILPSTTVTTASQVSERIRQSIEQEPFIFTTLAGKKSIQLTVSIGFSLYYGQLDDSDQRLIERADAELYRAKQSGRNQVCYSPNEDHGHQQVDEDEKSALFDMFGGNGS